MSARISFPTNDTPESYFTSSRGVRQGDHLSPILFIIAKGFLSKYLSYMVFVSNFTPISSSRGSIAPTYLLYTDDVILLCKGTRNNFHNIFNAFTMYGTLSGQKVSSEKYFICFGSSISPQRQSSLLNMVGISYGSLPFTCLGVSLFKGTPQRGNL